MGGRKVVLKRIAQSAGIIVALILVFWMSLTLVCCIPEQAMREHAIESADILYEQGNYAASQTEDNLAIDNFTPAWMLNIAVQTSGGNPFKESLTDRFIKTEGGNSVSWLHEWSENPDDKSGLWVYWRYWMGSLVLLKPLLVFFNVRQIQFIYQLIFVMLLFGAAISTARRLGRKGPFAAMALAFAYAVMHGFEAAAQIQFFPSFALSAIGIIWALRVRDAAWPIARGFLFLGAFTTFFDLLSNPLLTIGMPFCALLVRFLGEKRPRDILKYLALAALAWGMAYGIIWFAKWVLTGIVANQNVVEDALYQANYRAGGGDQGKYNRFTVILKGFAMALKIRGYLFPLLLGLLLAFVVMVVICVAQKRKGNFRGKDLWAGVGLFVLVGSMPYLWILVFGNHSAEHSFFTYRNQAITVFAILLCLQWMRSHLPEGFFKLGKRADNDDGNLKEAAESEVEPAK